MYIKCFLCLSVVWDLCFKDEEEIVFFFRDNVIWRGSDRIDVYVAGCVSKLFNLVWFLGEIF